MNFEPIDQIHENFRNMLLTNKGERIGRHDFGASLRDLTFDLISSSDFEFQVMNRIKEVRNDTQIQKNLEHEERDKEEFDRQTRNQFIKNYLEEKKATGDPIHTTEDNAQFKVEDDNEEINNRFNEWWQTTQDPEYKSEYKSMTFDDLDKYECISFGAYLNISFEDFDKFVKKYCWSRRRVGFWRVNEWGTQTFHFDVTNEKELQEHSKDFKIRQAKRLLEEEGIIEPNDKEELQEPPEPDYSKGI